MQLIVYGIFYTTGKNRENFDKSGSYNLIIQTYYCIVVFQK